jgi:hypothetical protein
MISFFMIVHFVLLKRSLQGRLAEHNQLREALLFDRLDPAFCVGIQVGTPGWQLDWFDVSQFDDPIKGRTELTVSVMQQVPAICQKAPSLQGGVPGHLLHPLFIWMWRHPGQADLAALQVNEKEDIVGDQSLESDNFNGEEVGPG